MGRPAEAMQRTLLILHPGAIGDVILALPAIRALRRQFHGHALGLVAGEEIGRVLRTCAEVDSTFALEADALAGLMAGSRWVSRAVREWLARCELAIGWLRDSDGRLQSVLQELGASRVIVESPLTSKCGPIHQEDRVLETLASVVASDIPREPLRVPNSLLEDAKARLAAEGIPDPGLLVALHPGSGSRHKCADPALFARIIDWVRARDAVPILLEGPADEEAVRSVTAFCERRPLVLHRATLLDTAAALAHARLFIGHDSGLTHLAAALHVPTVALFGPTKIQRWAPRGSHVIVLTGTPCQCGSWEAVQACVEKSCLRIPLEELRRACARMLQGPHNRPRGCRDARHSACLE
ncbi:MAG: glycosyltransferase family 9 protein [Nitrospirota bacterium]|nr:glycosyltransferase family 9 protein [Nitrospirota bacterium]